MSEIMTFLEIASAEKTEKCRKIFLNKMVFEIDLLRFPIDFKNSFCVFLPALDLSYDFQRKN